MKRHAAMMLLYNQVEAQLELSKESLASVMAQDIGPLEILLINNGSTQPTQDWIDSLPRSYENGTLIDAYRNTENVSPIIVTNIWYAWLYERYDLIFSVANDIIVPPNMFRLMAEVPRGMVAASMNPSRDFPRFDKTRAVNECTPMAMGMTRKWLHSAIVERYGYFLDPGFFFYASDCDLALRMSACGIRGVQLDIQYFHSGSGHWRMLPPEDAQKHTSRADADRAYFRKKWGFGVDEQGYIDAARDINFRGVVS